ncbi:MAG: MBL fold metallo-hydrolase [Candidatus Rokubacteria bacterium]|nr:MBL fold metallo-hydrolase [Candidatus Rokubacteria bacterium]
MRALLLGTGSPPPNPERHGPATLIELGQERFLVDAGSGVGHQLVRAGVHAHDWPRLLITHHHSDHTIDLGHLLITRWIVGQNAPWEIWGPAGTRKQVELLLAYLSWDIDVRRAHMHDRQPPEVRVTEIEEGKIMETGGVRVSAFLVEHDPVRPAFGFRFDGGGRSVVISGDTRPSENLVRRSQGVDCLIHECCDMSKTGWFPGCGWPTLEAKIRDLQSYHTPPDEVGRIAAEARARTLVLNHLMPASTAEELSEAAAARYAGPIIVGADLLDV